MDIRQSDIKLSNVGCFIEHDMIRFVSVKVGWDNLEACAVNWSVALNRLLAKNPGYYNKYIV